MYITKSENSVSNFKWILQLAALQYFFKNF